MDEMSPNIKRVIAENPYDLTIMVGVTDLATYNFSISRGPRGKFVELFVSGNIFSTHQSAMESLIHALTDVLSPELITQIICALHTKLEIAQTDKMEGSCNS
jgi:hypothetical protein